MFSDLLTEKNMQVFK